MDLSIIVPVYNEGELVRRCIESFLKQEKSSLSVELLLIDDGSTDESPDICDSYSERYDWIHTFHKKNGGCVDTRRYGIARARGAYLAFADGDDYVESDYLKNIEQSISSPADYYIFNNKKTFFLREGLYIEKDFLNTGYLPVETAAEWILLAKACAVWEKLFSRKFIEDNNISFDKNISHGEDMYINANVLMHRPRIYVQDTSSYVHVANSPTSLFALSAKLSRLDEIYIMYQTGVDLITRLNIPYCEDAFKHHIMGEFVKNIGLMIQGGEESTEIKNFFEKRSDLSFLYQIHPKTIKERIFSIILKSGKYQLARALAGLLHTKMYYRRLDRKVSCRTVG